MHSKVPPLTLSSRSLSHASGKVMPHDQTEREREGEREREREREREKEREEREKEREKTRMGQTKPPLYI